jgi:hypothetical protein
MTKRTVPQWVCPNPTGVFAVVHGSEPRFRVFHGTHPISVMRHVNPRGSRPTMPAYQPGEASWPHTLKPSYSAGIALCAVQVPSLRSAIN